MGQALSGGIEAVAGNEDLLKIIADAVSISFHPAFSLVRFLGEELKCFGLGMVRLL